MFLVDVRCLFWFVGNVFLSWETKTRLSYYNFEKDFLKVVVVVFCGLFDFPGMVFESFGEFWGDVLGMFWKLATKTRLWGVCEGWVVLFGFWTKKRSLMVVVLCFVPFCCCCCECWPFLLLGLMVLLQKNVISRFFLSLLPISFLDLKILSRRRCLYAPRRC